MRTFTLFTLFVIPFNLYAKNYALWNHSQLTLDNGVVRRVIQFNQEKNTVSTSLLSLSEDEFNYVSKPNKEFYFECNGKAISGLDEWVLKEIIHTEDNKEGNGAIIYLESKQIPNLQLQITYLLYPELPVIRKKISFINTGREELKLEAVDVENLRFYASNISCYTKTRYGRYKVRGPMLGNCHDPAVIMHHVREKKGIVLGNEAPGVIKRTSTFLDGRTFTIGLTHPDQDYAFRKWLKPGETWESPWTFICLYLDKEDPYEAIEGSVQDFVRRHMGIRLTENPHLPVLAYNHWAPLRATVDEELLKRLTDIVSECGIEEITLDAGWYTLKDYHEDLGWGSKCGDYIADPVKFPNGLEPCFDYISEKGLRSGLWISLAMASKYSKVYRENPDWFILDKNGEPMCVHGSSTVNVTACMTTEWYDYIKNTIENKVKSLHLNYVKLDLAIATSAYLYDTDHSGCHAKNHPGHRDQNESYLAIYRRAWQLFDELHETYPDLFIDCTFETMGASHLIDYDMCKHAEGNWLSNFYEPGPTGALQVRHLTWLRSPAIPASACVIGNLQLDDPNYELYIKSVAGVFPIILGDITKLTREQKTWINSMVQWMKKLQQNHNYMLFRQDLAGFGEPNDGHWDGFQRINTETKSGGLVGVFRNGALENTRQVFVKYLDPQKIYIVREEISDEEVVRMSGIDLMQKGFTVRLDSTYEGILFGIEQL
ncbi:glycoside hydrolase family 36 protein [Bacteroidota bacterium]